MQEQVELAKSLVRLAQKKFITLRIMGGIGIFLTCPTSQSIQANRSFSDIDLAGYSSETSRISDFLQQMGFEPYKRINILHGQERLKFKNMLTDIDIFLDQMRACHLIDFKDSLKDHSLCLSPTYLFLSKIQVVDLNYKDVIDLICLLQDCPIGTKITEINKDIIGHVVSNNWGLHHTMDINLSIVNDQISVDFPEERFAFARKSLIFLKELLKECPKSINWKVRNFFGELLPWYNHLDKLSGIQ